MRTGLVVPYADATDFADLAVEAEEHGWHGIFTWESVFGVDAWISLTAAAMRTEHIRLGTMLTPAARVRPWDLASRVGTLDRLSGGRVQLSVGLGALHEGWTAFEADEGRRQRAEKLDECLAIYAGLMHGQPFRYDGRHYSARPTDFVLPEPPRQRPHPPVWVVGAHVQGADRQRSLERAARWDGLLPQVVTPEGARKIGSPDELTGILDEVRALRIGQGRSMDGYDVVVEGDSTGGWESGAAGRPDDWFAAGATWWVESWWDLPRGPRGLAELRARIRAGPTATVK